MQIQEGPYLQYFCGLPEYKDEPLFEASTMVYFRKRLTAEILGEINELIIRKAEEPPKPQGGFRRVGAGRCGERYEI